MSRWRWASAPITGWQLHIIIQALPHSHTVELPLTQLKTVQVKGQGLKNEKIHLPYIVYLNVHIILLDTWLHTCLQYWKPDLTHVLFMHVCMGTSSRVLKFMYTCKIMPCVGMHPNWTLLSVLWLLTYIIMLFELSWKHWGPTKVADLGCTCTTICLHCRLYALLHYCIFSRVSSRIKFFGEVQHLVCTYAI